MMRNTTVSPHIRRIRDQIFVPILAGATLRDRIVACFGGLLGITLTAWICAAWLEAPLSMPMIVAPIGASAVLLFAVPASPLAQPWSIIGGNTISSAVGVATFQIMGNSPPAAGVAVAVAILAMSLCRCLHPPGGAAALTSVIGGPAVAAAGFHFPFAPVAIDSILLVTAGWAYHRFSHHSYPHRATASKVLAPAELDMPSFVPEDLDRALDSWGETLDVSREDLDQLLHYVEAQATLRRSRARSTT